MARATRDNNQSLEYQCTENSQGSLPNIDDEEPIPLQYTVTNKDVFYLKEKLWTITVENEGTIMERPAGAREAFHHGPRNPR